MPPRAAHLAIVAEFAALVVAFAGMVWRYGSAGSVARRQYRWVLSALVALLVALLIGLVGSVIAGHDNGPWWLPIMAAYVALPAAFMVAILRYRLYDIDRLISRTVTYTLVVAVLGLVYGVAVALLTRVLPDNGELAVAASTLAVVGAVRPLQRRVRDGVDRRFNRARFDAEREVTRFAHRLRGQTDPLAVQAQLRSVLARTLQPETVVVWLAPTWLQDGRARSAAALPR